MTSIDLGIEVRAQPDDFTCGPTCLQAVYRHFGTPMPLESLMAEVPRVHGGGTLAVHMGNHALSNGLGARLISWNLHVFDPTWFAADAPPLRSSLERQFHARRHGRVRDATAAYIELLDRGGSIDIEDLTPRLLRTLIESGQPVITGLSATYLYRSVRERLKDGEEDDVRGDSAGHFVVLSGYRSDTNEVLVSDPLEPNPLSSSRTYAVDVSRLIGAIYLGVLSHDANLLILSRPSGPG